MARTHLDKHPQRVLIVRPSALGDVCRTVPVLASLRAALPEAHIAWVVQDDFAAAIESHPALSEVIAFPRSRFGKWWRSPSRAGEVRKWFSDLRRRRFDVAIDCQGLSRSGLIVRASAAPLRIGLRSAREFAWVGYNCRVPEDDSPLPAHTVERMLALLAPLGVPARRDMRLYVPPAAVQWWSAQRQAWGIRPAKPYAVLAPGSRWVSKRWPINRFADLVEPLFKRGFERVLIVGSPSEREQISPLNARFGGHVFDPGANDSDAPAGEAPVIDLVGHTSIAQTMALIAEAGVVIANDSAPLHMAVGFDRPSVALFGPTDPAAVGPYARAECVVRAYQPTAGESEPANYKDDRLGDSLMRLISTSLVLQTLDRVLALWPQRGGRPDDLSPPARAASPGPANHPPAVDVTTLPRGFEPKAAS